MALVTSCLSSPEVRISSARLLQTKTVVSDGDGNQLSAIGYLMFGIESDTNLADSAAVHGAELWYFAETCDSHVKLDGWPYIYPSSEKRDGYTYSLLVGYKSREDGRYNLASHPEDVCISVGLGSMNPLSNARSERFRYSLSEGVREALGKYEQDGGIAEVQLSPECQARMCKPRYARKVPG